MRTRLMTAVIVVFHATVFSAGYSLCADNPPAPVRLLSSGDLEASGTARLLTGIRPDRAERLATAGAVRDAKWRLLRYANKEPVPKGTAVTGEFRRLSVVSAERVDAATPYIRVVVRIRPDDIRITRRDSPPAVSLPPPATVGIDEINRQNAAIGEDISASASTEKPASPAMSARTRERIISALDGWRLAEAERLILPWRTAETDNPRVRDLDEIYQLARHAYENPGDPVAWHEYARIRFESGHVRLAADLLGQAEEIRRFDIIDDAAERAAAARLGMEIYDELDDPARVERYRQQAEADEKLAQRNRFFEDAKRPLTLD